MSTPRHWLKLDFSRFRSNEQTDLATADQLAAWLRCLVLAAERRSGGVLKDAMLWDENRCRHYLRFGDEGGSTQLRSELIEMGLLIRRGDDLVVHGFDVETEEEYVRRCQQLDAARKAKNAAKEARLLERLQRDRSVTDAVTDSVALSSNPFSSPMVPSRSLRDIVPSHVVAFRQLQAMDPSHPAVDPAADPTDEDETGNA